MEKHLNVCMYKLILNYLHFKTTELQSNIVFLFYYLKVLNKEKHVDNLIILITTQNT